VGVSGSGSRVVSSLVQLEKRREEKRRRGFLIHRIVSSFDLHFFSLKEF
jgi:hypothetical protein